jgi:hypothetical protein
MPVDLPPVFTAPEAPLRFEYRGGPRYNSWINTLTNTAHVCAVNSVGALCGGGRYDAEPIAVVMLGGRREAFIP